jgi:hypothetical protein
MPAIQDSTEVRVDTGDGTDGTLVALGLCGAALFRYQCASREHQDNESRKLYTRAISLISAHGMLYRLLMRGGATTVVGVFAQ